jgi:hypothetical protein
MLPTAAVAEEVVVNSDNYGLFTIIEHHGVEAIFSVAS